MALFRREPPPSRPPSSGHENGSPDQSEAAARLTLVAAESTIDGDITGKADVRIEGRLRGNIRVSSRVIVALGGTVEGVIEAGNVIVAGTVLGSIQGVDRIEIAASGVVEGEVCAPRLVIADGGFLKGATRMGTDPQLAPPETGDA